MVGTALRVCCSRGALSQHGALRVVQLGGGPPWAPRRRTRPRGRFLLHENWASDADLDTHLSAPHLTSFAARIPELLDERGLTVNRVRRIA